MRIPSVMNVSPASGKLGLAPVSHTLSNSFDLVLRDRHRYLLQHYTGARSFLMPLLLVGPSVQRCPRRVKIADRSDQSIRTTLFLLILVRCVLALLS